MCSVHAELNLRALEFKISTIAYRKTMLFNFLKRGLKLKEVKTESLQLELMYMQVAMYRF